MTIFSAAFSGTNAFVFSNYKFVIQLGFPIVCGGKNYVRIDLQLICLGCVYDAQVQIYLNTKSLIGSSTKHGR